METWMIIAIATSIAIVLLVIATLSMSAKHRKGAKQSNQLREGFGPEYTKAVGDQGRASAEVDLLKRQERADLFKVRALTSTEVARYTEGWAAAQAQFVDDPGEALSTASRLVGEVIAARGYPAAEFEQGASALSVDHPRAVQEYRAAHTVLLRNQRNPATVDDLRAAMLQYHSVFTELMDGVGTPVVQAV